METGVSNRAFSILAPGFWLLTSSPLPPLGKPVNEVRRQLRIPHFCLSELDVVLDAIEFHSFSILIPDCKAGSSVSVARLADRSRIHEQFLSGLTFDGDELIELVARGEDGVAVSLR